MLFIEIYKLLNGLNWLNSNLTNKFKGNFMRNSCIPWNALESISAKLWSFCLGLNVLKIDQHNEFKSFQHFGVHVWIANWYQEFITVAQTDVQLHGFHPDYMNCFVIYRGYENILNIALRMKWNKAIFIICSKYMKSNICFYENEGFTWFYDMKLSLLVYIVFIVHIAISIVGD